MPQFQDRESIVARLTDADHQHHGQITVITGEAGIGKSSVLGEAARQIRAREDGSLVLEVDFGQLARENRDLQAAVLEALAAQAGSDLLPATTGAELSGLQLATQLNLLLPGDRPVSLFFDTTEAVQDQRAFWRWLEEYFLQPLVSAGRLHMVFAGRIAPPFQLFEVRRALYKETLHSIGPQPEEALIREVLLAEAPQMSPDIVTRAIQLVRETAFGHPALSESAARYVAAHHEALVPGGEAGPGIEAALCEAVVDPFVRDQMMQGMEPPWTHVLPWITVLNWFDTTILTAYLKRQAPDIVQGQPDHFFIQGITQLRQRDRVIWRESLGYQVEGIMGDIVRHCLAVRFPQAYRDACQVAADTFQGIADTFHDDPAQAGYYQTEAEFYKKTAARFAPHSTGGPA